MTIYAGKGWHSYEIQVGKLVVQIRHRGHRTAWKHVGIDFKPSFIHVFIDRFGKWR